MWIVLLLLLISAIILASQNWEPTLAIVLFGNSTISLPLAVWLFIGISAGILSSILIQLLMYRPASNSPDVALRYREKSPKRAKGAGKNQRKKRTSKPRSDWEIPSSPNWDDTKPSRKEQSREEFGEWDIEEAPSEKTVIQPDFEKKSPKNAPPNEEQKPPEPRKLEKENFPEEPPAETPTRQQYEAQEQASKNPRKRQEPPSKPTAAPKTSDNRSTWIYDAEYRVITPPFRPENEKQTEAEEGPLFTEDTERNNPNPEWDF